jgi:hypothetical protein
MGEQIDRFDSFDFSVIDLLKMWSGYASTATRIDMRRSIQIQSAYPPRIPQY